MLSWMMNLEYRVVDAFADGPFKGNPAAVVVLESMHSDTWLQNVAMEMNLSETAFLLRDGEDYQLRWFTPCIEVDLCGHATLASAVALADLGQLNDNSHVRFHTRSGPLVVTRSGDLYEMDFPVVPAWKSDAPSGLIEALAVEPTNVAQNKFDYLVEVSSAAEVRAASPNFSLLAQIPARGILLTAKDDSGEYDFVSRFFAPAAGINEDPVTGSGIVAWLRIGASGWASDPWLAIRLRAAAVLFALSYAAIESCWPVAVTSSRAAILMRR